MNDHNQLPESDYLGITEAAEYLRVSASTLRRWEKKGFLVPERTPTGIRRYTKHQLDAVMHSPGETIHPTAEPAKVSVPIVEEEVVEVSDLEQSIPTQPVITNENQAQEIIDDTVNDELLTTEQVNIAPAQEANTIQSYWNNQMGESEPQASITEEPEQEEVVAPRQIPSEDIQKEPTNVMPLSQDEFESMFHLEHTISSEDEEVDELEEYDNDAAVIDQNNRIRSYSAHKEETPIRNEKKSSKGLVLFAGIFVVILVIGVVVWLMVSTAGAPKELLSPVVQ